VLSKKGRALAAQAEADRVVYKDTSAETGFFLVVDQKWVSFAPLAFPSLLVLPFAHLAALPKTRNSSKQITCGIQDQQQVEGLYLQAFVSR